MRDFRQPNFNSQIGEEIKQVFRSAVLEDEVFDEDGINVELAAPWRRVAAAALNLLIMLVFTIGVGFIAGLVGGLFGNPALIGYGAMLAYVIGQAILMANSGHPRDQRRRQRTQPGAIPSAARSRRPVAAGHLTEIPPAYRRHAFLGGGLGLHPDDVYGRRQPPHRAGYAGQNLGYP